MPGNIETGRKGQQAAEAYLLKNGYDILARNFRLKTGEIDLIARDGEYVVFIEVKCRNSLRYGLPREAVTKGKQRHIIKTAQYYILTARLPQNQDYRFDVIEVMNEDGKQNVTHIENAFM
jgi:putative endonuclease